MRNRGTRSAPGRRNGPLPTLSQPDVLLYRLDVPEKTHDSGST